jgi:hypothetical protein
MNLWLHGMGKMIDRRMDRVRRSGAVAALMVAVLAANFASAGCGGSDKAGGAKAPETAHAERAAHEPCGESQGHVDSIDANGDGKPDVTAVTDHGREVCRSVDLDHDGKPDLYEYFDSSGEMRRREFCYDQTGTVNAIELYEGGKLVRREYDIAGQHKIDTWDWFDPNGPIDPKTGRPAHPIRRERDTKGSGQVDQWWTWNGDQVTIAFDKTGEGKPDPSTAVVLGRDGNPVTAPPAGSNALAPGSGPNPGTSVPEAVGIDGGRS